MEKDYIRGIVMAAAQEVFSTMLGMEGQECAPVSDEESTDGSERVVALIGLAGSYIGTGMIGCSARFACQVSSVMLMSEYSAVDSEVLDAIGEISNMIFGNVKTALENEVGVLGLSIPTVVFGRNFSTRSIGKQSWINVPLKVEAEEIDIRFCIAPNSAVLKPAQHGFQQTFALSEA